MSEPLHPNLAKLAAAYDAIIARFDAKQITIAQAHAEISQLEARDDQGIRWSIDPISGEWVRKTATGDTEYDSAPPQYGYMTPDAFDYTANPQVFNPADAIQFAPVDPALQLPPSGLLNATRTAPATGQHSLLDTVRDRFATLSRGARIGAALLVVAVLALILRSCSGSSPTRPAAPAAPRSSAPAHQGPATAAPHTITKAKPTAHPTHG